MTNNILLALKGQSRPDCLAFQSADAVDLDYQSLLININEFIQSLEKLGIRPDDPVAFIADNTPGTSVIALSLMSHAIAIPINPDFKQTELEHLFSNIPVKAILVPSLLRQSIGALWERKQTAVIEYSIDKWNIEVDSDVTVLEKSQGDISNIIPDDTALILQTSGSTAAPKFVPLSHNNILSAADNVIRSLSLTKNDKCLHMLPMFHVGGLVDVLLAPLLAGGSVVFNKGFDVNNFFKMNREFHPTWTQTVPAMLKEIMEVAIKSDIKPADYPLRFIRSVSAPLPKELYQSASKVFSSSIVEIYGMTECAGVISSSPIDYRAQKMGSVGTTAGPEIRIIDEQNQTAVCGQTGEIQIRGDSIMKGYLATSDKYEKPGLVDGWFGTGDLGHLDEDGYLFITGRLKDIINRGGEKISPTEIDQLMMQHPLVMDAASFPVQHPSLGEDVGLALVITPGEMVTQPEIKDFLRKELAYFKIPRLIYFVDDIPRTNGKLKRHILAEQFVEPGSNPEDQQANSASPQSSLTKELIALWSEVLEMDDISPDGDFFFLGGDSLSATILVNKIQTHWDIPVLVTAIYDAPVLQEFEYYLLKHYPKLPEKI
jgi:acyl-CoA synthetase (AMP-forming)/AMP-acid ligase II